jgi:hypothetical protein
MKTGYLTTARHVLNAVRVTVHINVLSDRRL